MSLVTGASGLTIEPLTPTVGAVVHGVDLTGPPAPGVVAQIRGALLDHLVVFFRDQHLTREDHVRFGESFGELDVNTFQNVDGDPRVLALDQAAPAREDSSWHADFTYRVAPPMGSILRCIQMPAAGGDSCFASMYAAYDVLSSALRDLLDDLHAVNTLEMMGKKVPSERLRLAVAFWDNRAVLHHPVPDYQERRVMERVTIVGDRPFGPSDAHAAVMTNTGR